MNSLKAETVHFAQISDLKPLLSASGPCLTVYIPLSRASSAGSNPNAKQNHLQWRECLRSVAERIDQFGPAGRELFESLQDWTAVAPDGAANGQAPNQSLVVFRSPDIFQVALVEGELAERAVIGPHFYIRPLLADLARDRSFYLLALSQNDTRLLHCTTSNAEVVPLPPETEPSFDAWQNRVKPDHNAVYNAMAGPSQGSHGPAALAPQGNADESDIQLLVHYFKQIAHGVGQVLKDSSEPLVLCAVEYEQPLFRRVNIYPHLVEEGVKGAPNGLKAGEMHARALEVVAKGYDTKVDAVLAQWDHRVGAGASSRLKEVVTAAHEGRILHLVISDTQEKTGVFHEDTFSVQARETGSASDEDLINDAAVQVLLHGGNVLVTSNKKLPNGDALAAVFRY